MPRPSIVPEILTLLEPYLDDLDKRWEATPEGQRLPTLPITEDGKVNVRALTLALGLRKSQEQHFYKHPELAAAVNAIADIQGVARIGSRVLVDAMDEAVADRLRQARTQSSDLAKTLAEREALIERQRREIAGLREQLALLEEGGMVLRTGPVQ